MRPAAGLMASALVEAEAQLTRASSTEDLEEDGWQVADGVRQAKAAAEELLTALEQVSSDQDLRAAIAPAAKALKAVEKALRPPRVVRPRSETELASSQPAPAANINTAAAARATDGSIRQWRLMMPLAPTQDPALLIGAKVGANYGATGKKESELWQYPFWFAGKVAGLMRKPGEVVGSMRNEPMAQNKTNAPASGAYFRILYDDGEEEVVSSRFIRLEPFRGWLDAPRSWSNYMPGPVVLSDKGSADLLSFEAGPRMDPRGRLSRSQVVEAAMHAADSADTAESPAVPSKGPARPPVPKCPRNAPPRGKSTDATAGPSGAGRAGRATAGPSGAAGLAASGHSNAPVFGVRTHEPSHPPVVVVAGAGDAEANGAYDLTEETEGSRPVWIKRGNSKYRICFFASNGGFNPIDAGDEDGAIDVWIIDVRDAPAPYCVKDRSDASVPLDATWVEFQTSGNDPAPTVTDGTLGDYPQTVSEVLESMANSDFGVGAGDTTEWQAQSWAAKPGIDELRRICAEKHLPVPAAAASYRRPSACVCYPPLPGGLYIVAVRARARACMRAPFHLTTLGAR